MGDEGDVDFSTLLLYLRGKEVYRNVVTRGLGRIISINQTCFLNAVHRDDVIYKVGRLGGTQAIHLVLELVLLFPNYINRSTYGLSQDARFPSGISISAGA